MYSSELSQRMSTYANDCTLSLRLNIQINIILSYDYLINYGVIKKSF